MAKFRKMQFEHTFETTEKGETTIKATTCLQLAPISPTCH